MIYMGTIALFKEFYIIIKEKQDDNSPVHLT